MGLTRLIPLFTRVESITPLLDKIAARYHAADAVQRVSGYRERRTEQGS